MPASLSVRIEQLGCHGANFIKKILHLSIFRKPAEKIQVALDSNINIEYFKWMPVPVAALSKA
jgi:hypothetical protein